MKKQSLIKGTLILGAAGICAKFLGLFFRWPLQMLIGDEGVGYYQMSYPLYTFFIAIASGIPVAISKLVSERNAIGDREGIIQVLRKALLLMIIIGSAFSIFIVVCSKQLITFLKWDSKSYYSLMGIAIAPIFISIMATFRGFFQGLQNMNFTATSQIIEQLGRVFVGVGLAFILLPMGIQYSAGGAAFGAAAGGMLGGTYLILRYLKLKKEIYNGKVRNNVAILSKIIYIAIPISLGATVGSIMSLLDSFLVPQKLLEAGLNHKNATILYGQLTGKAFVLINVPLTLSVALCASIVPIIAEAFILNRRLEVMNKVDLAMRITMAIALPSFIGLFFMASPILHLIFPGQSEGYNILKYLSIAIPFIILSQTGTSILQATGNYAIPVVNLLMGCIVKVFITIFLVPMPSINIYGAVIGTVSGYIIASILNVIALQKVLQIRINYYEIIIKPAFASVLMIIGVVFTYTYVYNYTMSNGIATLISIILGIIIYAILIVLFGVFNYTQLKRKLLKR